MLARLQGRSAGRPWGQSWALAAVSAVLFVTFLDNTIVSVVLADLQGSLHLGVSDLQWVVDAYMLTFAALMLTGGTLGDLFGRKKVMLFGLALFCVGALLSAVASSGTMLVVGRVVMGVGAAGSEPGTLSVLRHIYPERRERALALGVWSAVSGVALSLGPIIGGVLVAFSGWRAVFWLSLGLGLVALGWSALVLPESRDREGRRLDLWGFLTSALMLSALTAAVIEGENAGYGSWWVAALFALALLGLLAFIVCERRSPDPLLKPELLRLKGFNGANLVAFCANFAIFAVFFFTTLYLQLIAGFSGYDIALVFVAMAFTMIVSGVFAGHWTARNGPRLPMTLGCLLGGGGLLVVDLLLKPTVSLLALVGPLALAGFGLGMVLVAMTAAVLTLVPAERSGLAASTVNTSRELGGVFGVAVLGALINAQLTGSLARRLKELGIPANFRSLVTNAITHGTPVPVKSSSVHSAAAKGQQSLVDKVVQAAQQAAGHGIHLSLAIAAGLVLFAAVLAFALMSSLRSEAKEAGEEAALEVGAL